MVSFGGWVRTVRQGKGVGFVEVNDGSCFSSLQVVVEPESPSFALLDGIATGASVWVTGTIVDSPGKGQKYEVRAESLEVVGPAPEDYPLQKKRHSFEYLREIAHLRPRTNTFGAVLRIRNILARTVHDFFQSRGFLYVQTPIITTSDCEGAGEMFGITVRSEPEPADQGAEREPGEFFGKPAGLTVSGQLEAEAVCSALGDVYTFGPTFRAENSNTSRHLSEFWMVEPEMAFADIHDDMDLAEDFLRHLIRQVLEEGADDMAFFDQWVDKGLVDRLRGVLDSSFQRISYTEAIERLQASGKSFEFPLTWGLDLQSEHERFLTEELLRGPVIVTDYPRVIKPFYMKQNEDGRTVRAMDVLVPGVGEIMGGSQREDNLERLERGIEHLGLDKASYWWYLDLRRYGSVPHAGFGLGFERAVQYITGMQNIRDVIPFPRTPRHAEF